MPKDLNPQNANYIEHLPAFLYNGIKYKRRLSEPIPKHLRMFKPPKMILSIRERCGQMQDRNKEGGKLW